MRVAVCLAVVGFVTRTRASAVASVVAKGQVTPGAETKRCLEPGSPVEGPLPSRPLDEPAYEADELGGIEGLGEKSVDARFETGFHLVLRTGADDGEGKVAGAGIGTQPRGGPETVQTRHDDIEGHEIGPHLMHDFQTLGTIGRGHDLEALQLEIDPDQLPDDLVVVHNKHLARSA